MIKLFSMSHNNEQQKTDVKGLNQIKAKAEALKQQYDALNPDQKNALELLQSGENVFLTGGAGCGKSFVIKHFVSELGTKQMPILASTGAAAVLVGGRTFHSFFGLGIMEGGPEATFQRAINDKRLAKRLREVEGIILDEVSMISGEALVIAEALAQNARDSKLPWGGLRVVAVGDFAQLPPVTKSGARDWAFAKEVWNKTGFLNFVLTQNERVQDDSYLSVLNKIRVGVVDQTVAEFLNRHTFEHDESDPATRLFPRRDQSLAYNLKKLGEIDSKEVVIDSIYFGTEKFQETMMKQGPVPPQLTLKVGAEVMFIQNDSNKRWVNGTRGTVVQIEDDKIIVEKFHGRDVTVEKQQFSYMDADGNVVASVIQFPLALAYATTIHKSQGATLDELWCDLSNLWEPGQAYVALSRLRFGRGLKILKWNPRSIKIDPMVRSFYEQLG
jgi:ATP-dependent exoDNAse (exonuclease V) alpha subunit